MNSQVIEHPEVVFIRLKKRQGAVIHQQISCNLAQDRGELVALSRTGGDHEHVIELIRPVHQHIFVLRVGVVASLQFLQFGCLAFEVPLRPLHIQLLHVGQVGLIIRETGVKVGVMAVKGILQTVSPDIWQTVKSEPVFSYDAPTGELSDLVVLRLFHLPVADSLRNLLHDLSHFWH